VSRQFVTAVLPILSVVFAVVRSPIQPAVQSWIIPRFEFGESTLSLLMYEDDNVVINGRYRTSSGRCLYGIWTFHWAVKPPSTASTDPWQRLESAEAKNRIAPATSSADPMRPIGMVAFNIFWASCLSGIWSVQRSIMPVSITPGHTQFIRTPELANSIAMSRVNTTKPPLALP
jgi:hypothetical protein